MIKSHRVSALMVASACFVLGLALSGSPAFRLMACVTTGATNLVAGAPTIANNGCASNKCYISSAVWSATYQIDNSMQCTPAQCQYKIQVQQREAGSMSVNVPYDTGDLTVANAQCQAQASNYDTGNQTFSTSCASLSLGCHISMPPGTHFEYSIKLYCKKGTTIYDSKESGWTDSGC
jgi:hypothetical protein